MSSPGTIYDHTLLPVDGSDEARRAAKRGLEFARAFGTTVDVLHVVEEKPLRLTRTADEGDRLRDRWYRYPQEILGR
ncbi:universal stress protein [Natrinema salinisoli]|uniref:universal stress protein n=1 Tax=Natrinema salinisoli TaxID=2878535 RepID=UPI003CCD5E05